MYVDAWRYPEFFLTLADGWLLSYRFRLPLSQVILGQSKTEECHDSCHFVTTFVDPIFISAHRVNAFKLPVNLLQV